MRGRTSKTNRTKRGSGFIEVILAAVVLVPIALGLLDMIVLVIANQMNDTACKNAARAAANQYSDKAMGAAQLALASFRESGIVKSIEITGFDYPAPNDSVACETTMIVRLPAPVPGLDNLHFKAVDVEPIMVK